MKSEWARKSSRGRIEAMPTDDAMSPIDLISKMQQNEAPPRAPLNVKMGLAEIEKGLNRQRFGAKYELDNIIDDVGETIALELVSQDHPSIQDYQRHFPELRTEETIKHNNYSAPTKTWSG